ncbi:UDP-N-acetylglucosamine 2-epimerase [Caenimonas aquaedulcis]|uniref:UDP-N-acetylglucosamine 2-epimerase (Hydrolyzing) n=1 Tax=Caenimonas aquaedulcis TaxID=2793270 RepID=A0A931H3E2_9BURK|nr:UDP-N-acetylglucosamine 2-epimerase [Caenimonas aquaedulcis]MBG9387861.1 UDP-N-acetylglucosamine 2-epimerase (hydrolyzing) [Caenimonas aquaedulcis]
MSETATRRIVYLSGTRADFGLMQSTLQRIAATPGLAVQVAVTGTHLSKAHGETITEIRASGLPVCAEIPVDVSTRTPRTMSLAIAEVLRGMTELLDRERPDVLLLLGDRGEMLAGAVAALHLGVPCVHVHGGELSGTVDEPVRHAISKLAAYHFVATAGSRERLLRMGEAEPRIFVTGAPGLDGLAELGNMSREECARALGLTGTGPFVLALFHPVVQQAGEARTQTLALIEALGRLALPVVWLEPNADAGSLEILAALDESPLPPGSKRLRHVARPLYASALRHCAVLAGNSSSGIIEAASFGTPVVNIGDRQRLRERNPNVTDAPPEAQAMETALRAAVAHGRWPCENLWGDGHAGERIAQLLATLPLQPGLLEKINSY